MEENYSIKAGVIHSIITAKAMEYWLKFIVVLEQKVRL
jgi:hypothetical protein